MLIFVWGFSGIYIKILLETQLCSWLDFWKQNSCKWCGLGWGEDFAHTSPCGDTQWERESSLSFSFFNLSFHRCIQTSSKFGRHSFWRYDWQNCSTSTWISDCMCLWIIKFIKAVLDEVNGRWWKTKIPPYRHSVTAYGGCYRCCGRWRRFDNTRWDMA